LIGAAMFAFTSDIAAAPEFLTGELVELLTRQLPELVAMTVPLLNLADVLRGVGIRREPSLSALSATAAVDRKRRRCVSERHRAAPELLAGELVQLLGGQLPCTRHPWYSS